MKWSFDLLDDRERTVLMRCCVFAGGFDLAAATDVAGDADCDEYAVLDILDSLQSVWMVELAPVGDPEAVPAAVATSLGVLAQTGGSINDSIAEALSGRKLLVILDNCEHVLDAVADMVETLLRQTTEVSVVATSREGLRVGAEHLWPVPSLDVRSGSTSAAVRLFVERARAVKPDFTLGDDGDAATVGSCR